MHCAGAGLGAVRQFCSSVNSTSATHLSMLREIEELVTWLSGLQRGAEGEIALAERFIDAVNKCADTVIDPDNAIQTAVIETETALKSSVEILSVKKASAFADQALKGDNEDAVVTEYDNTIEAYTNLHDAMSDLRWAIMEHDANLDEDTGEEYDSPEAVIKALRA